jgi:hypothetical protein
MVMPMHARTVASGTPVLLQEILANLPSDGVLVTHVNVSARANGALEPVMTGTRSGQSLSTGWVLRSEFQPWTVTCSGAEQVRFTGLVRYRLF